MNANGHDATAARGDSGQFDVIADGRLVFSKEKAGRHAGPGEVLSLLQMADR